MIRNGHKRINTASTASLTVNCTAAQSTLDVFFVLLYHSHWMLTLPSFCHSVGVTPMTFADCVAICIIYNLYILFLFFLFCLATGKGPSDRFWVFGYTNNTWDLPEAVITYCFYSIWSRYTLIYVVFLIFIQIKDQNSKVEQSWNPDFGGKIKVCQTVTPLLNSLS